MKTEDAGDCHVIISYAAEWMEVVVQPADYSTALAHGGLDAARRALEERSAPAILVDASRLTGRITMTQRFLMAVHAVALRFPVPLAVLGPDTLVDPDRFGQMVARARGGSMRVFTDRATAERWLRATGKRPD